MSSIYVIGVGGYESYVIHYICTTEKAARRCFDIVRDRLVIDNSLMAYHCYKDRKTDDKSLRAFILNKAREWWNNAEKIGALTFDNRDASEQISCNQKPFADVFPLDSKSHGETYFSLEEAKFAKSEKKRWQRVYKRKDFIRAIKKIG